MVKEKLPHGMRKAVLARKSSQIPNLLDNIIEK